MDADPTTLLAIAPLTDLRTWLAGRGLEILLVILGSVLLARLVEWIGGTVTARIDRRATGGDALVRSEAAKHRHSLTQVLTWAAVVLIYSIAVFFVLSIAGVPVTGLVAPATVLGVGLGFGAQRIVGDVLAGFFIITERQYGFGDVVQIAVVGGGDMAAGTVEDVTLRITRLRSADGEVVTVPNGQIVKVINLSRDWARAVIDVPVPTTSDVNQVNETLREVGRAAFRDAALRKLLLDEPSVMGVESLGLDQVNVRLVARTLPGKQFEVGRDLRARIVLAFRRQGLTLPPSPQDTLVFDADTGRPDDGRSGDGAAPGTGAPDDDGGRHAAEPAAGTTREVGR
jgi:small conductance mechanosensitive channel